MKKKENSLAVKIVLLVLSLGFLFPLVWMLLMSVKEKVEIVSNPFGWPSLFDWANYSEAFSEFNYFVAFKNSMVYTFGTCITTLFLGSMVSYAIARTRYRFSKQTMFLFTLGLVIPVNVVMIPLYSMILKMGLKGTASSLILPYTAFQLPATVLMLYAFLRGIPMELEDAAAIDGAGIFTTFFRIIFPILIPALTTRLVIVYLGVWNEFTLALVLANNTSNRPLPIALLSFFVESMGTPDWGVIGAAMVLCSFPSALMYLFGNKQIEKALTASGGMK